MSSRPDHAEVVVDLDAISHNVATLKALVAPTALMTVVKADGYGHGMRHVARAARAGGADWLGVATVEEAIRLRADGAQGPILCWLATPGARYADALAAEVDVTASSTAELAAIEAAARASGHQARVHLKVDTGLRRGGASLEDWPDLIEHAVRAHETGDLTIVGVSSHLAAADLPDHPANDAQEQAFRDALDLVENAGLSPRWRHLANSAAAVLRPSARFDLVRCGIASYGLDPTAGLMSGLDLRPAMTVRAPLAHVKRLRAGDAVSYGHTWRADRDTTAGLVPVGYAEGVPRHLSNRGEVFVAGARRPIRGIVCMDQFVIDLGDDPASPGDEVLLFGPGTQGEPTAQDWAQAADTINYEVVTRMAGRLGRRYVGHAAGSDSEASPVRRDR